MSFTMYPYIHIGPFALGTFGALLAAAFLASYYVLVADFRRRRLKVDVASIVLYTALAGIVGAKIWHLIDTPETLREFPSFAASSGVLDFLRAVLSWSRTGVAWFGGFVGGLGALILFARHYRIPLLRFLDACSPAAAVGYAVGRIGCLISGDGDYGTPTTSWMGMGFPNGIVPTPPGVKVWPTPIFETVTAGLIAWYLWRQGGKATRGPRAAGEVLALYLILMGLERFLVEFIRNNPRIIFGMSNAQTAALLSVIVGVGMLAVVRRRFRPSEGGAQDTVASGGAGRRVAGGVSSWDAGMSATGAVADVRLDDCGI